MHFSQEALSLIPLFDVHTLDCHIPSSPPPQVGRAKGALAQGFPQLHLHQQASVTQTPSHHTSGLKGQSCQTKALQSCACIAKLPPRVCAVETRVMEGSMLYCRYLHACMLFMHANIIHDCMLSVQNSKTSAASIGQPSQGQGSANRSSQIAACLIAVPHGGQQASLQLGLACAAPPTSPHTPNPPHPCLHHGLTRLMHKPDASMCLCCMRRLTCMCQIESWFDDLHRPTCSREV